MPVECSGCKQLRAELELLRKQLEESEAKCARAEQVAEKANEAARSLEREIEEMHDNFKEEECEQFEQVKQELDIAIKNCKILQIRLNKSERQYAQLEQVKLLLERQLEDRFAETTLFDGRQQQTNSSFVQVSSDCVKLSAREYDQLLRDSNDLSERERDLQEQIKYSQEEAQLKSDRLQSIEAENEILLERVNKLTVANSRLRSLSSAAARGENANSSKDCADSTAKLRELYEQNEQLKLMLELSQSECQRLKGRLAATLDASSQAAAASSRRGQLERQDSAKSDSAEGSSAGKPGQAGQQQQLELELECRQLRARLIGCERELRQQRAQLEFSASSGEARRPAARPATLRTQLSADSATAAAGCAAPSRCAQSIAKLESEIRSLRAANERLSAAAAATSSAPAAKQPTQMECDLLERLKQQLNSSESELAKARSRLVELDLDCGRAQRQYKRLLGSLETCGTSGELQRLGRKRAKLPPEQQRDAMNRQELREALRDLESELDEMVAVIQSKECLIKELSGQNKLVGADKLPDSQPDDTQNNQNQSKNSDEQIKSLRRLLEQERLLSNNLKLDVSNLEQLNLELQTSRRILERERVAMEEELDKLRQLTSEMLAELEESQKEKQETQTKNVDLIECVEKLRLELAQAKRQELVRREHSSQSPVFGGDAEEEAEKEQKNKLKNNNELLLMARDLSELKVKNGFLMRQLEISRDDASKQVDELRQSCELQTKRAVEMAQLELRERHLSEIEQLRDESSEWKQKLAMCQRQLARQEEETNLERERTRACERDWRRDKSQWQQTREQLDGQLHLERRSSEFKLKELEAVVREKERNLISVQDKCVQFERDFNRLQNKHKLLEEDLERRIKMLSHELETKSKELNELRVEEKRREESSYEQCRRLTNANATLSETLETIRRSYDDKLVELKRIKEINLKRQEQAFKEKTSLIEQLDLLNSRVQNLSEFETQSKLLRQRLEALERQLEIARRELVQVRDERTKLKTRCEELEKRERISKTNQISGSSSQATPFLKSTAFGRAFSSSSSSAANNTKDQAARDQLQPAGQTVDRLSGKINDQRHLINVLRQQLDDSQFELKQLKLLQASTRSKWQAQVALTQSRLNQCEERLAFETSLMVDFDQQTVSITRGKFDSTYASERNTSNELIKQQQAQIELLTRDLKKISQSHDMLRLHNKQLELHNSKLSQKLIEYQQVSATPQQAADQQQQQRNEQVRIVEEYERLANETRPLISIINKIVRSLDASAAEQQQTESRNSSPSDSTNRPLRTPSATVGPPTLAEQSSAAISTAIPAHQVAAAPSQPSRLVRMIAGGSTAAAAAATRRLAENDQTRPKKVLRKVRVKCSSLGITPIEKKQLKQHLQALDELVPKVSELEVGAKSSARLSPTSGSSQLAAAALSRQSVPQHSNQINLVSSNDELDQHSHTSSRVRWAQLDSDVESERSWSVEPAHVIDRYRRFPQAAPGGGMASLTDYESESSLASDYSLSGPGRVLGRSGAESDSGLANSTATSSKLKKRSGGIKGRLTNTLRSISRSITGGFGSDSEISERSATTGYESRRGRQSSERTLDTRLGTNNDDQDSRKNPIVGEIRV